MDVDPRELAGSVPLVFVRCGRKFYARTSGGEIAYGDSSGLYEWRDGQRIHYSGGDRQGSSGGFLHQHGDLLDTPFLRGLESLKSRRRLN